MKTNSKNSRKNNYSIVVVALLIISAVNFSCSKPENGTNGTNGVDGKNGTNGTAGTTGPAGTANVIFSNWETVTFSSGRGTIIAPSINQNIIDRGAVLIYTRLGNDIYPLPYVDISSADRIFPEIRVGLINIIKSSSLSSTIFNVYRYIIIPGGTPSGRGTTPKPDYKSMTYSQVCASLNIPE
jgi:hypothetical protein